MSARSHAPFAIALIVIGALIMTWALFDTLADLSGLRAVGSVPPGEPAVRADNDNFVDGSLRALVVLFLLQCAWPLLAAWWLS